MATDFSGLGRHPATVRGSPSCPDAVDSGALAVLGGSHLPAPARRLPVYGRLAGRLGSPPFAHVRDGSRDLVPRGISATHPPPGVVSSLPGATLLVREASRKGGYAAYRQHDRRGLCEHQGGTRSRQLCQLVIELLQWCGAAGITLHVSHIPGRLNVLADGLSRSRSLPTEWELNQEVFLQLLQRFPGMTVDVFATRFNTKLPRFVSPVPDPTALSMDGLSFDWHDQDLYASPPFPLVPKVLQRLLLMECDMTLIAPLRWNRSAVSLLLSLLVEVPILLPCRQDLLQQRDASLLHPDPQSLCLHAFRLSSRSCRRKSSRVASWIASQATEGLAL